MAQTRTRIPRTAEDIKTCPTCRFDRTPAHFEAVMHQVIPEYKGRLYVDDGLTGLLGGPNASAGFPYADQPDCDTPRITFTPAMIDGLQSDDELAGILGHEWGHVALRHTYGCAKRGPHPRILAQEIAADVWGARRALAKGFDPEGAITALDRMASDPHKAERIRAIRAAVAAAAKEGSRR